MAKMLMKGNEAVAEAAIQAGCRYFFGYPITPQNEIPEYMSARLPKVGGTFLQAESEVAAINMVYGAAGAGARVMTSSSSPGISLKQEGISYMIGAELPAVIVNMVRGGPGLGSIQPAQSDYYQATRGGGHGDYRTPVFVPASIQEAVELTQRAFDVADQYRNPVMVLGDGMIGQMMEPVEMPDYKPRNLPPKTWATTGWTKELREQGVERRIINSLYIEANVLEKHVAKLMQKYAEIEKNECMVEEQFVDDADIIIAAYGTTARICLTAVRQARAAGIKCGLIRPITVWPFPSANYRRAAEHARAMLCVEMSCGQMIDDVRIAVEGRCPVAFYGRTGGMIPSVREVYAEIEKLNAAR